MNRSLQAWCCVTGIAITASIATAAHAAPLALHLSQKRTETAFDLPAQTLVESLHAIGKLTGINILIDLKMLDGLQAPALKGDLTADQAIARVLSGTGIRYRFIDERTVVLSKDKTHPRLDPDTGLSPQAPAAQPQAQTSSEPAGESTLEEIVVTAQKREERLLDVPISIVALTAADLQKRQINNIDELSFAVPGLFVASSGSFQREISIRGISNVFGNSSLIGLYVDEMSVTSAPCCQIDLPTYDLERVEVLRGPQGTLYGEGSAGGTIRFITKNPVLDRFSFDADVATLFTEDGAPSQRVQEVDEAEHHYFAGAGLKVVGGAYLGISDGFALAEPSPDTLFELGVRGFDPRADGLIMTCLNTRSHTVIDRLEQKLGKPVITSTQATLWHALRLAGIADRIKGYGRLLDG